MRTALKKVDPDDTPMQVWECLGEVVVEFLIELVNNSLEDERMLEDRRIFELVIISDESMELWEIAVEADVRSICEQQYGFRPKKEKLTQTLLN